MSFELLDDVARLLGAASRTKDAGARSVFVAEARIRIEQARKKTKELEPLTAAAEAHLARLMADAISAAPRRSAER